MGEPLTLTTTVEEVNQTAKELSKKEKLKKACKELIEAFYGLFEQKELVKSAKETVKNCAERNLLNEEEIKLLIKLCELRAKGDYELKGDLVQQRLFDLENEKEQVKKLLHYLPPLKRLEG